MYYKLMCFFIPGYIIIIFTRTAKDLQSSTHLLKHTFLMSYYALQLHRCCYPFCCYPYHRKVKRKEHSSPSFIINRPFCSVCPSLTKQAGAFCSISSSLISSILQIDSISSILMHISVSFWKNYKNVDL